jgi:hypothetical protein
MHAHRSHTRPARCTYPVAAMAIAAALILYLGTYAEVQLAKQGTYTGRFGWSAVGKTVELESEHALFVGEFNGVVFNDAGSGFLHGTAFICPGLNDLRKGLSLAFQGYCIVTNADGDTAYFACTGRPVTEAHRVTDEYRWTSGIGKYTGMTGNNTFEAFFITPLPAIACSKVSGRCPSTDPMTYT